MEPKPDDDPATAEDESKVPATTYISVVNSSGVNTGYTIDLQWFLVPFEAFEAFQPPKDREVSRPVTASRTPPPFVVDEDLAAALDEDAKILIPGPDGELIEQTLGFYEAGNRLTSRTTDGGSWVPIATIACAIGAVLAFAYLVVQRRRREAL
jgi:hypothetical protein